MAGAPNRLKTVSAAWLGHLPALGRLFIHYNEIDTIQDGAFNNLTQLKTLDLSVNRLKTVRYDLVRHLVHLEVLYLEKNPYHCDCQMAWVREKSAILDGDPPLCTSPPSVSGTSVLVYDIPACPTTTTETGISFIFLTFLNIQQISYKVDINKFSHPVVQQRSFIIFVNHWNTLEHLI